MKKSNPFAVRPAQLARAQRWSVGQPVTLTKDDGTTVETTTRSAPWKLCGTWVVMVEGISGGYALARVAEREEITASEAKGRSTLVQQTLARSAAKPAVSDKRGYVNP